MADAIKMTIIDDVIIQRIIIAKKKIINAMYEQYKKDDTVFEPFEEVLTETFQGIYKACYILGVELIVVNNNKTDFEHIDKEIQDCVISIEEFCKDYGIKLDSSSDSDSSSS